jgi:hypothetical protein
MIDLPSVFTFFHKAKWTERVIRHEINRALGENNVNYSTLEKYV